MTSHGFPPTMARYFNWNLFRQTPPSLSIEELSQCSKIGIDAPTLQLAKYLCNQYPIQESRKQDLAKAVESSIVSNIHADSKITLGDDLYYLLKLISNLAASDDGISLLCICNVLGYHYPAPSTMEIFAEIVKEAGVPENLVPTLQAWQSLKPLFESLQGPPVFGLLVDKYTALGNQVPGISVRPEIKHMGALGVIENLHSMFLLVRGEQEWILSVVGRDAGWVAAVGEWIFGLKIELRGSLQEEGVHGEKVLYSNCGDGVKAQMVIRFNPPGVPVDREPIVETPLEVKYGT